MRKRGHIPELKDLIDQADADLLRSFLWKQAKRSSSLDLKLRAYLVEDIDPSPGVNRYGQVISLLVRHDVHGTIRLTRRSIQILRDICEHFISLQSKHLQQGELRNAWEAGIAVIGHIHMLMDKYHGPDTKLIAVLTECYAHIITLLRLHPAPELVQNIYADLKELTSRSHHVIYDLDHNAIISMIQASSAVTDMQDIADLVIGKINSADASEDAMLKTWCALLLKIPLTEIDLRTYIRHDLVYDVAHILYASKDYDALARLLRAFSPHGSLTQGQQLQWTKWNFEIALQSGSPKDIQTYGLQLLQLDQNVNTYRKIREVVPQKVLHAQLQTLQISDDLLGSIYAEEQEWDFLAEHLRKTSSMLLLTAQCAGILENVPDAEVLIEDVVNAYTTHHGGPKSVEEVSRFIELLVQLKQIALAGTLADTLRTEFPGRFDEALKIKGLRKNRSQIPEEVAPEKTTGHRHSGNNYSDPV